MRTRRELTDVRELTISTTVAVVRHLDRLVETGLFGHTVEDAADILIRGELCRMLERRSPLLEEDAR